MRNTYKGSVTLFLSLCLSSLIILIISLTSICIRNAEKIRIIGITDIVLNSCLGEYSIALHDEYGMLYIDLSYLSKSPDTNNLKERINYYISENTNSENAKPWGRCYIDLEEINALQYASSCNGRDIAYQIDNISKNSQTIIEQKELIDEIMRDDNLDFLVEDEDYLEAWGDLMECLEDMNRPMKFDFALGKEVEVELDNPAAWVYGLAGNDIVFNSEIDIESINSFCINIDSLCSHNNMQRSAIKERPASSDDYYLAYLASKMGCYKAVKEDRILELELEYLIAGKDSDYKNLREVIDRIYKERINDNFKLALGDASLFGAALGYASTMEICQLAPEYLDLVAKSMVYAAAYLETISDMHCILSNGRIPLHKQESNMSIYSVINNNKYFANSYSEGFTYQQYLLCMIHMMNEMDKYFRTMDLMEIFVRNTTNNSEFSMNYCIDIFDVSLKGGGSYGLNVELNRTYGYF